MTDTTAFLASTGYIIPSFHHYNGLAGSQTLGPLGTKLRDNIISRWKDSFLPRAALLMDAPIIVPKSVLKASGHEERFTDPVVRDTNGRKFRVDHLLKNLGVEEEKVDSLTSHDQAILLKKLEDKMEHPIDTIADENLMFATERGYLRPELAQGLFVHFKEVQHRTGKKLPFGLAQVGTAFRNEITTHPLSRLREFHQMELEWFFDPRDEVALPTDMLMVNLLPNTETEARTMSMNEIHEKGLIKHPYMVYFLNRIWAFALQIGLNPDKMRLRQHHRNEMAHYSSDCWDLEAEIDGSWLECIGCSNRGNYDLSCHRITVPRALDNPYKKEKLVLVPDKKAMGPVYKKKLPQVLRHLETRKQDEIREIRRLFDKDYVYSFDINLETHVVKREMVAIELVEETVSSTDFVPHVIEPSFGLDRLMYAVLQHSMWKRPDDERRVVVSLQESIVPYRFALCQLSNNDTLMKKLHEIDDWVYDDLGTDMYTDLSSTGIGKRYVRLDEMGIKYAITIDFQTLDDDTVTVRDRDTTSQKRVGPSELEDLIMGKIAFNML